MIQCGANVYQPGKAEGKEDYMKGMAKITAEDKNYLKKSTDGAGKTILLRAGGAGKKAGPAAKHAKPAGSIC